MISFADTKDKSKNVEKIIQPGLATKEGEATVSTPPEASMETITHSPISELPAGKNDVEEKMTSIFAQMESIESTESTMTEMANLFEFLPKVMHG